MDPVTLRRARKYTDEKVDQAVGELHAVATSGDYDDLANKPTLGTAAAADTGDFATAAQGALADTAVQPSALHAVATSGDYDDLANKPTLGTAAAADIGDFATAAQGALADTAVQPAAIADFVSGDGITDIVALTRAEYNNLTPDATTLYFIKDE